MGNKKIPWTVKEEKEEEKRNLVGLGCGSKVTAASECRRRRWRDDSGSRAESSRAGYQLDLLIVGRRESPVQSFGAPRYNQTEIVTLTLKLQRMLIFFHLLQSSFLFLLPIVSYARKLRPPQTFIVIEVKKKLSLQLNHIAHNKVITQSINDLRVPNYHSQIASLINFIPRCLPLLSSKI